ncbi:MAG: FliH/SctL family protein [Phycisphaerales bacterium]
MTVIKNSMSRTIARDALVLDLADVRMQAQILIDQARKQAEQIVSSARAERERLIAGANEQGHKDGYAKGFSAGQAAGAKQGAEAGLKEHRAALEVLQKSWTQALDAFASQRDALMLDANSGVIGLALEIAQRVVKRAVQADPAGVVEQVRSALQLTLEPSRVRVRVHPSSADVVARALPDVQSRLQNVSHVELVGDDTVEPGGCRVLVWPVGKNDQGASGAIEIDATIRTQLDRIAEALLPGQPREAA